MLDFKQIVVVICILDAVLGQGKSNNCPKDAELGSVCYTYSGNAGTCKQPGNCKNNKCQLKCEESPPCGCVPHVMEGSYSLEEPGNTDYGASATLTCCSGYQAAGDTITCEQNGIWSDQSACVPLDCGTPPSTVNGDFMAKTTTTVGSIATISCYHGYGLPASSISDACIVCQPNGNWSDSSVHCTNDCGFLPDSDLNGIFVLNEGNTLEGATATLACCNGYSANVTITCGYSDWSSPSSTCSPNCCDPTPYVCNGEFVTVGSPVFGDIATLECNDTYTASSSDTCIRCTEDGSWTNATATCINDCGCLPDSDLNGIFVLNEGNTLEGATATLACCNGYSANVTITCGYSDWSSPSSTCSPNCCDPTPYVCNGEFVTVESPVFGDIATLECNDTYTASSSDTCIRCTEDGSWTNATATCITSTDCGCVPDVMDGKYTLDEAGNTDYGANATLTCRTGYQAECDTITCEQNGIWSDQSACVPLECPEGWLRFMQKCYLFGNSSMYHSDAQVYCEGFTGGRLVQVDTRLELYWLKGVMISVSPQPEFGFWNGLMEELDGIERWQPSRAELDPEVADWNPGQPSGGGPQTCTIFAVFASYKMADVRCENIFRPSELNSGPNFALCEQVTL